MIEVGDLVIWIGIQDEWCAPSRTYGTVLAIAHHDEDSLKVEWDDRYDHCKYTWERRKNLMLAPSMAASVPALVPA